MRRLGLLVALLALLVEVFRRIFQPWQHRWGATDEEATRALVGDEFVTDPDGQTTRAITVEARPEHIWPWLAQMGHGRGGLYSWDFLDIAFGILDRPSAKRVLPEFQDLRTGDEVPVRRGPPFPVLLADPGRALVLGSGDPSVVVSWQTVLEPIDETHTRLITRNRVRAPHSLGMRLFMLVLDAAGFVMVVRWLQVLRERAEGLRAGTYA